MPSPRGRLIPEMRRTLKQDAVIAQAAGEFFTVKILQQRDCMFACDVEKVFEFGHPEFCSGRKPGLDLASDFFQRCPVINEVLGLFISSPSGRV